ALAGAPPAHAEPPGGPRDGRSRLPSGKSWTVTLLTGDVVRVRTVRDRPPLVSITPAKGRRTVFSRTIGPDGSIRVVPADMLPLVGRTLDPALFDVTGLIEQGYDDARTADVPLIVERAPGVRAQAALGGTLREGPELTSLGAVAARQPKKQGGRLAGALSRNAGGIRHIWLDRKVKATATPTQAAPRLDRNLTQVGAPTAWRAGATGKGVRVAVLDTGADAAHPDLRGRIAASRDFAGTGGTTDRNGHGTHVAATVAGTGAASRGERKGVAPGASLLVGKVLNDEGEGTDSMVIAGMEWAAARARIVTMSLGGFEPSDGTDALSRAVDRLTAEHGTLFVVAAGNTGSIGGIAAPGAATSALTVGAVDAADRLADFSDRGPRFGRPAAKPEIVAPGVEIVAARAAGTSMGRPIDGRYTAASGTSMATPHVAGAAALLAQRHPGWKAPALKAALTGSTDPAKGGDVFERGTGRLDAGAAVTTPAVTGQSVIDLGTSPYGSPRPLTTTLTWRARKAVRLTLSVRLTDREGRRVTGAARLSAATVNLPAGGTGRTALRIDPAKLPSRGLFAAEVTARGGGAVLRTHATFHAEPRMHTLTIKATPLPGPAVGTFSALADVVNIDDIVRFAQSVEIGANGVTTVRVPRGRYSLMGKVADGPTRLALAGDPEVLVDRDLTVTLDGAGARQVTASVQDRTTTTTYATADYVRRIRQGLLADALYTWEPDKERIYVQPTEKVATGSFTGYLAFQLTAPGEAYNLIHPTGGRFPENPAPTLTPAERARMFRVDQRFAAYDGDTTKTVGQKRYAITPEGLFLVEASLDAPAGSTRTDYLTALPGVLWNDEAFLDFAGSWVDQMPFREVKPGGRTTHTWGRLPFRPGPVSGTAPGVSFCAPPPTTRTRGIMTVALVPFQTRIDGFDCTWDDPEVPLPQRMALFANGRKIAERALPAHRFPVPAGRASYRLEYTTDASKYLPVSTRTATTWTFTSQAPKDHSSARVPLLLVDYHLPLDLRSRPIPGKEAVFTVARLAGTKRSPVTSFALWTSTDDGKTWTAVKARPLGNGRYAAPLPATGPVSLRVRATDEGGSGIDQRIIRAYR
ncbi:MAG TPA: S8 family serine peptidase, partial [Thermomonospora sp.]|nr:S8 family serine peptidase [Thermomonospora sp.]